MCLRERYLKLRMSLSKAEIAQKSALIRRSFLADLKDGVRRVGLYASFRNEVLAEISGPELRSRGIKTFYPRVSGAGLLFAEVLDEGHLRTGSFGIREPVGDEGEPSARLDVIVTPGVVFDESGYRVGSGHGYYDRTMQGFSGLKVGLAFELQLLPGVPHEGHDIACDVIVTEKRFIRRN